MGDVNRLNRKCNVTENRLVEQVVAELVERHAHTNDQGITVITRAFKNEDNQLIIKIAKKIIARKNTVFCITNREGKKVLWIIGCWEKIDLPFHMIRDELLKIIQGKGGGRHPLWQGIGGKPEAVDQFLSAFKEGIFTTISD